MRLYTLFLLALTPSVLYAQKVDQIIESYRTKIEATTQDANFKSIKMQGEMCYNEVCFPARFYLKSPKSSRVEVSIQNAVLIQISNDSLTWEYNPISNVNKLEKSKESDAAKKNDTFNYANTDLIYYKERGHKVKLLDRKKIDSLETFVVELTKRGNLKSTFYINTNTFLVNKVEDKNGSWYFANYARFDALYFPMLMIQKAQEEVKMKFKNITVNQPLPDSLFVIPAMAYASIGGTKNLFEQYYQKAEKHYDNQKPDSAILYYDKAIRINNESEAAFNKRGLAKIDIGDYYGAIGDFNRVLEINPSSAAAWNNRGLAKYYLNDQQSALTDYNQALKLDKSMAVAYQNRGLSQTRLEKYEEAIHDFDEALRLRPQEGVNYFNKAVCLGELGRYEEALVSYAMSLRHHYATDEVYNYKGVSEYQLEKYDSAIASFTTAIKRNSKNATYVENLGRSYYALTMYENALNEFDKSIKLSPETAELYNMRGLCQYFLENYKAAIKDYTKAIELNPENASFYDNRAAAKEGLDDYVGAIIDYDESIKLYPNDAAVFYNRGMAKIYSSKKYEGCLDLATANEMNFEDAKEAILKNCN